MGPSSPAAFLNLDLEIDSSSDLSPLAAHLADQVFVLFCGEIDRGFRLVLEPTLTAPLSQDPLACTEHFLRLLSTLPEDLETLWRSATSRVFDYGVDGGLAQPPLETTIPADLLLAIAQLGAGMRVTVYPFREG